MADSFESTIESCDIFAGCNGLEAIPREWRDSDGELQKLIVFGYGSVIWKPGIEFEEAHVGYINGFVRRMWQGNETHRGRKGYPGRVATLIPKKNKRTYGKAFVLKSKEQIAAALDHLIMREISLGGYCLGFTPFYPLENASYSSSSSLLSPSSSSSPSSSLSSSLSSSASMDEDDGALLKAGLPALVFSATTENEFYLGPEKMSAMARTVACAEGPSGHNVEYLVKICDFMRDELPPHIGDNHLFTLERLTLEYMANRGVNFKPLAYPELFNERTTDSIGAKLPASLPRNIPEAAFVSSSFSISSTSSLSSSSISSSSSSSSSSSLSMTKHWEDVGRKLDQARDDMERESDLSSSNPTINYYSDESESSRKLRTSRPNPNLTYFALSID